ncbi:uncharacterized protein N7483_006370 [Penicillium malachiteum]|uniref:uncharacterized protein n=1 Tax=Penicillium malachiteum TaxID=1324776 RepID=UPI002546BFAA|nr:uncharacterized protein N7483_006370 [Penicillium malachiteum]KAJ5725013.1 hypothetical protein N7483_006370 [Penicillium malachiteum]
MSNYQGNPDGHQGQPPAYYPPQQNPNYPSQPGQYAPGAQQSTNNPQYGIDPTQQGQYQYPPQYSSQAEGYPNAPNYGYPPQQNGPQQQPYQPRGENASYYQTNAPPQQQPGYAPGPGCAEGDKGLGSTLVGGAAGGYAGHQMAGGFLGTAGGAILGAVGMNMATHEVKKHKKEKKHKGKHHKHHKRRGSGSSSSSSDSSSSSGSEKHRRRHDHHHC